MEEDVIEFLQQNIVAEFPIYVACSGGVDSTVLLHMLLHLPKDVRLRLEVIHVYHGTESHPAREAMRDFVESLCARWSVPCHVIVAPLSTDPGHGEEERLRMARYAAFQKKAPANLLIAHHADDSAETILMNLMRGCGVHGVCGIPACVLRGNLLLLRPLIHLRKQSLLDYAERHHISFCPDPSNTETVYRRNWVRHQVFPLLDDRWSDPAARLLRFSSVMAEVSELLEEIAEHDEQAVVGPYYSWQREGLREIGRLRTIELIRRRLALYGTSLPPRSRLEEWIRQIYEAEADDIVAWPYEGVQCFLTTRFFWIVRLPEVLEEVPSCVLDHFSPQTLYWPALDADLVVKTAAHEYALSRERLKKHRMTISTRRPGMTIRLSATRPHHAVKLLLQEARIPNWMRDRWPVLLCDGVCVAVLDVAVDYAWKPQSFSDAVSIHCEPFRHLAL